MPLSSASGKIKFEESSVWLLVLKVLVLSQFGSGLRQSGNTHTDLQTYIYLRGRLPKQTKNATQIKLQNGNGEQKKAGSNKSLHCHPALVQIDPVAHCLRCTLHQWFSTGGVVAQKWVTEQLSSGHGLCGRKKKLLCKLFVMSFVVANVTHFCDIKKLIQQNPGWGLNDWEIMLLLRLKQLRTTVLYYHWVAPATPPLEECRRSTNWETLKWDRGHRSLQSCRFFSRMGNFVCLSSHWS